MRWSTSRLFFSTLQLKTKNCIILKFDRRTVSDEEQEEMVFFFAIDFHAMITPGENVSMAPTDSRSHGCILSLLSKSNK